ncbi:homoserine O-acetyltransferase [Rhodopirellula sp. MGV]|uniref:homoserine O-acetyltransferase MetX n=1 Tax=Rhodopirellula sp. MGV TaxID=2023130 RepID=UPI000B975F4A|nr:homoserine O-acetyltransferase [Rhodopirellula sp. MGV]OYP31708.1 homoserine O-acetyltransferase [Rhodopirellula sp. MGV]PNY34008.1 homoserine O-acetyltransferase [Rhodopirellula baltica]
MSEKAAESQSFESTDDNRVVGPLTHARHVAFDGEIELERGSKLDGVRCAFETWGELNDDASNAVLVCHALSGDSHAARHGEDDDPGWWDDLIGPGKPIDTDHFFVICPNVLGGCRGTTGPGDLNPQTGKPYGADFPRITIGDMVTVQKRLIDHLGIKRLRAIIGGSLGGHQAMSWVSRFPDATELCVVIASSARLTSQALGFDVIGRNAIQTDPHFYDGQYYDQPERPDTGLAIARMLGHITYLSTEVMEKKFESDRHDPREVATSFEQRFSIGSYLAYQGQKFTTRFDANSYVTITMAMDLFDLGTSRLQLMETFGEAQCEFVVVSFSSDWLFTPHQSRDIVNALTALDKSVTYAEITSPRGHDSFLINEDIAKYAPLIQSRLGDVDRIPPSISKVESLIINEIPENASVLDLGCGDGHLLAALKQRGHQKLVGVEVAQSSILNAGRRGLNIIDYDLNEGLPAFIDNQFDVVVLSATLQAVANIEKLFDEMLRVGKRVIVSFPNFAYKKLREDYVVRGRSPKAPGEFGYEWFNTPNRRFPSIADVHDLCQRKQLRLVDEYYFDASTGEVIAADDDPNLNADTAILVMTRE